MVRVGKVEVGQHQGEAAGWRILGGRLAGKETEAGGWQRKSGRRMGD